MTKEERIKELAAALEPLIEEQVPALWEIDSYHIASRLTDLGFGNLRTYKAKLIELYLKGDTSTLLKFIMEEEV